MAIDLTDGVGVRRQLDVVSPATGQHVARLDLATGDEVERVIAAAHAVRARLLETTLAQRVAALEQVASSIRSRRDELAEQITAENGKPIRWARVEVERAEGIFAIAARECAGWSGEAQRLDAEPSGAGRLAYTARVPHGAVLAISPFNFPLHLTAHKVAPALAVGAPVVVKPSPRTPLSARSLVEMVQQTDLPDAACQLLVVDNESVDPLITDPRLPVISFTGSDAVGWAIKDRVPRKHVTLELGGNAAAVIAPDWCGESDLAWAAERLALFGNYQGGQACVSVQRVYVPAERYTHFCELLVQAVQNLRIGDLQDPETVVGPLIDEASAERVVSWMDEARDGGARVLLGGDRVGSFVNPSVLVDVPGGCRLRDQEVFGPVIWVEPYSRIEEAFAQVNDSVYGLHAGVFTRDVELSFRAHRDLEVGGVVIGDAPTYRSDQMPYGGTKASGVGREGVRSAMLDYTYERVLVWSGLPL
jgi:acyl-CoA reductase-like NAD-dependent aldehyde dehydrogenase